MASYTDRSEPAAGGLGTAWAAVDWSIVASLAVAGALAVVGVTWANAEELYSRCLDGRYFEGDTLLNLLNISDRNSFALRSSVHPIWILLVYPAEMLLVRGLGLHEIRAVWLINAVSAGAWLALIYGLLRSIGLRRGDALVFTLLAGVSAAALFWFPLPETYCLGTISLLVPLLLVARKTESWWAYLLADAFSLGITVTNWMSGIAATVARFPLHKAVSLLLSSLVLVGALFGAQRALFPFCSLPVFLNPRNATFLFRYVGAPYAGGHAASVRGILFHGMVAPAVSLHPSDGRTLTFQMSGLGSSGTLGVVATTLWAALMVSGVVSLFVCRVAVATRLVFGAVLLGQLGLHTVFGDEAFLYGLHVTPLLVVLSALTTLTRARIAALLLAIALIPCAVVNNTRVWLTAIGADMSRLQHTRPRVPLAPIREAIRRPVDPKVEQWFRGGPPSYRESCKSRKWLLILPMLVAVEVAAVATWNWPRLVRWRTRTSGNTKPVSEAVENP